MNAENMNNMKKSERRIFRYTLADAWRDTISQVEVLEGIENKNVRCLYFDRPHRFVRTGNTSWGIQNLAYDPASGNCYAAVYKGKKSQYPNYSLFVIDGGKPARRELLQGFDTPTEGEVLSLVPAGKSAGGIYGWDFKWGRLFLHFAERPFEGDQTAEQHRSPLSVDRRCGCPLPAGRIAPLRLCHAPGRSQERPGVFLSAA